MHLSLLNSSQHSLTPWTLSRPNLNHGLEVTATHVYASESTTVYRWPLDPVTHTATATSRETVVVNINADGRGGAPFGHTTRTLVVDPSSDTLFVSVGSHMNIDVDSFRSRIRRFSLSDPSVFPLDFLSGEVYVDGLRNEVGMTLDASGTLWGVGNSADKLERADLGGDIHNDNPAEEMHKFVAGQNYGYPYCWREYELELGLGTGSAWAWPTTMDDITDEQCRADFAQPMFHMPAHSAPLGLDFYRYDAEATGCDGVAPFPSWMNGYAFIAYHGSWNRDIPTGYKVVYVPVSLDGEVTGDAVDLLTSETCCGAKWVDGTRPVDVSFDPCGRLLVTSDGTRDSSNRYTGDKVIRVEYIGDSQPGATSAASLLHLDVGAWCITLISTVAILIGNCF